MSEVASASLHVDLTIARVMEMAERHQRVLCEMQEAALAVTRVYADLAIASAQAAQATLAPDAWHPELERAQAIGASRHAAEAFHRVTRALRLTMAMERAVVEGMVAREAGILAAPAVPIFTATIMAPGADIPPLSSDSPQNRQEARVGASESSGAAEQSHSDQRDLECLSDVERDNFGRLKFRQTVERICTDIGVKPDWARWDDEAFQTVDRKPPAPEPGPVDPPPDERLIPASASRSSPPGSLPLPRCESSAREPGSRTASG